MHRAPTGRVDPYATATARSWHALEGRDHEEGLGLPSSGVRRALCWPEGTCRSDEASALWQLLATARPYLCASAMIAAALLYVIPGSPTCRPGGHHRDRPRPASSRRVPNQAPIPPRFFCDSPVAPPVESPVRAPGLAPTRSNRFWSSRSRTTGPARWSVTRRREQEKNNRRDRRTHATGAHDRSTVCILRVEVTSGKRAQMLPLASSTPQTR